MELQDYFKETPKAALAFSGGVDSGYLLYAAKKAGCDVAAYYVRSAFQPAFELADARRLCGELGVELRVLPADVLSCGEIVANRADRCYHCKQRIFRTILSAAERDGYSVLLDGTNASDDAGDRPGMRALEELQVLSPLRLCGLSKADVRRLSGEAGLFTHDKPAYACLATRIPTGTPITQWDLTRVENAEDALRAMGFSDLRVRLLGQAAKLQLPDDQFPLALEKRTQILAALQPWFSQVLLDLKGRT